MASAEHEPIVEVLGQSPQWGPEAKPLIKESGGKAPRPEAGGILISNAKNKIETENKSQMEK